MKLTPHFSLKELTRNEYAVRNELDNTPDEIALKNLNFTATRMEQIRAYASKQRGQDTPIVVHSAFRSLEVNRALGSDDGSAHILGLAVDFGMVGYTSQQAVDLIQEMKELGLISYTYLTCQQRGGTVGEWVHIDFADIEQSEILKPIETEKIEIRLPEKNPDDWVTPNFSKREMTRSDTAIRLGIANTPNAQEWAYIKYSAEWLEKIRAYAGRPIIVSSCFRCVAVNRRVGGSSTSAHCFGLAVDFDIVGYTSAQTAHLLKEMRQKGLLDYDQNILEFPKFGDGAWVHIGFKPNGRGNRRQELTANRVNGKTRYSAGLQA